MRPTEHTQTASNKLITCCCCCCCVLLRCHGRVSIAHRIRSCVSDTRRTAAGPSVEPRGEVAVLLFRDRQSCSQCSRQCATGPCTEESWCGMRQRRQQWPLRSWTSKTWPRLEKEGMSSCVVLGVNTKHRRCTSVLYWRSLNSAVDDVLAGFQS